MKFKVEGLASDSSIILVNGKKFQLDKITSKKIDNVIHDDKFIYKELNEEKLKSDMDLIVNTLSELADQDELIRELLKNTPAKSIRRLAKRIRDKKPIKKQYGCLGFKIGDAYVQLIE
jgi:hypothetical protein